MMRNYFLLALAICSFNITLNAQGEIQYAEVVKDLHKRVNNYRNSQNLGSMQFSNDLSKIALIHSQNMALGKVPFSHEGFNGRVQQIRTFHKGPYRIAENLYMTNSPYEVAKLALSGWIKSPGHHKNLKGSWTQTGIGITRNKQGVFYVTQLYLGGYSK